MSRRILVLLLSAIAIPATAQTFGFSLGAPGTTACLSVGHASWRLAPPGAAADITVRIDAAAPDLQVHLAATPDEADLVLVDDGDTPRGCHGSPVRSVAIDAAAATPDVTIALTSDFTAADYRIYLRSRAFTPDAAAALLAASHVAGRKPRVAHRSN